MQGRLARQAIVTGLAAALVAALGSAAKADQYFHTSHADLSAIGSAPLRSGFVNDIHTNGATIAAQERYQLSGAEPQTTYTVALHISFADSTCKAVNLVLPTSTLATNASGNGEASFTFFQTGPWPPQTPPTLSTVYIRWVVSDAAGPEYQTGCIPVVLGG